MKQNKYIDEAEITGFFDALNRHEINYYIISNVAEKIPCRLLKGKDIDIVVHKDSWNHYLELLDEIGFVFEKGAKTRGQGWILYNGTLDCVKRANREQNGLEIDAASDLCLQGFQPNRWIPMDSWINEYAWENRRKDNTYGYWYLDDCTMIVYLIAHCIFDKKTFNEEYRTTIYKYKSLLEKDIVNQMLRTVFYGFTDRLIQMVKNENYEEIYKEYFAFSEY